MHKLINDLHILNKPVTIVFDNRPIKIEQINKNNQIKVLFTSQLKRNATNNDIATLMTATEDPATLCVITSDTKLAEQMRISDTKIIKTRTFREQLKPK